MNLMTKLFNRSGAKRRMKMKANQNGAHTRQEFRRKSSRQ